MTTATIEDQVMALISRGATQAQAAKECGIGRYRVREIIAADRGQVLRARPIQRPERQRQLVEDCLIHRASEANWIVARAYGITSSYVRQVRAGQALSRIRPDLPRTGASDPGGEDHPFCIGCVHWNPESLNWQSPCGLEFPEAGTTEAMGCAARAEP